MEKISGNEDYNEKVRRDELVGVEVEKIMESVMLTSTEK